MVQERKDVTSSVYVPVWLIERCSVLDFELNWSLDVLKAIIFGDEQFGRRSGGCRLCLFPNPPTSPPHPPDLAFHVSLTAATAAYLPQFLNGYI